MVIQKKQLVAFDAKLKSFSLEISSSLPEIYRIVLFGEVSYGETENKMDLQIDIASDVDYNSLAIETQTAVDVLIAAAKIILLEKYVLK